MDFIAYIVETPRQAERFITDVLSAPVIAVDTETVGKFSRELFLQAKAARKSLHKAQGKLDALQDIYAQAYCRKRIIKQGKRVLQESRTSETIGIKAKGFLEAARGKVQRGEHRINALCASAVKDKGGLHFYENHLGCLQLGYEDADGFYHIALIRPGAITPYDKGRLLAYRGCIVFQNYKFDYEQLKTHLNLEFYTGCIWDTMIVEHILTCGKGLGVGLKVMSSRRLGLEVDKTKEVRVSDWLDDWSPDQVAYAAKDLVYPLMIQRQQQTEFPIEYCDLYRQEHDAIPSIARMKMAGVHVDVDYAKTLLDIKTPELEEAAYALAEHLGLTNLSLEDLYATFNSTKLLPEAMTKALGFPVLSTGKVTMKELRKTRPELVDAIWAFRKPNKLISTYIKPFIEHSVKQPDGSHMLYGNFNQAIVNTGRLSSSDPFNFQNMPKTKEFRDVVVAPRGYVLVQGDLATIEPRILAFITGDPVLIRAFNNGRDVYKVTASLVFGIPYDEVDKQMRKVAKVLMLSIVYGKTVWGMALELQVTEREAWGLLNKFFAVHYPVKRWVEATHAFLRDTGYVETLGGRRRHIQKIHSSDPREVAEALREGPNTVIQGTAADCMKRSIVRLDDSLLMVESAKMILSVHDELVARCLAEQAAEVGACVKDALIKGCEELISGVPILVGSEDNGYDVNVVKTWGECVDG